MVYLFENFRNDIFLINEWKFLLSSGRIDKVEKYKFNKDRLLSTVAFVLLRYGLELEYNITAVPEFVVLKSGKPFLKDSDIHFNISHCENAVLCGIDKSPIGVDIQEYCSEFSGISYLFTGKSESEVFKDIKSITRLWTLKEAYGKLTGEGICYDLKSKDFSCIRNIDEVQKYNDLQIFSKEYTDYALSICSKNVVQLKVVKKEELMSFVNGKK